MNLLNTLNEYHSNGLLYKQVHPKLPLTIWNYAPEVQYKGLWDDITVMCRGLVTDDNGNIVARPFKKFWNLEENRHTATKDFQVFNKLDGSLGILFYYEGEWIFASRGSFISEQAEMGYRMLNKKVDISKTFNKEYTYLFEIIYDTNKIVVNYPFEDVVLLSKFHTLSGEEATYERILNYSDKLRVVKRYDSIADFKTLKSKISDNEEGFVVLFSNGERLKIKGEEYLRLHKIMTNVSTKSIWEVLAAGESVTSLLVEVPDEFYNKILEYERELKYKYLQIDEYAWKLFSNYRDAVCDGELPERAEYAKWVKLQDRHLAYILFRLYTGNTDYSNYIWKLIKPEFKKL